jgi:hypothetical protein
MTIGSRYGSLAIMGDTNFDSLDGYVAPAGYQKIAPPNTSVATTVADSFKTGRTKAIDVVLLPVS